MGSLSLPASGTIYVDTAPIIYAVERHPDYESLLLPLWAEADAGSLTVITSELTLLETLVKPFRNNNQSLIDSQERLPGATSISMRPITANILRAAARIRATTSIKTPDAIHAATALSIGCAQFITNDAGYRKLSSLPVVILKELI
jgi:predicted nucleic acid-binding protein